MKTDVKKIKTQTPQQPTEQQLVTMDMLKMFYERASPLTDNEGKTFEAPAEGALGLLALGHVGLIEWRKSKGKHLEQMVKEGKITKQNEADKVQE